MEEEGEILHHCCHSHPLTLIEKSRVGGHCDGCWKHFSGEEVVYGCSKKSCGDKILLHEECAEMPREIWHPMHPPHILRQTADRPRGYRCQACGWLMGRLGYTCDFCPFSIHLRCAQSMGTVIGAADDQKQSSTIKHDSHPAHELRLLRRRHSFRCDACGTIQKRNSYICMTCCQYWIHESCASLPTTMEIRENLHHHPLSLAFHPPQKYIKFDYKCDICRKDLLLKHWVYHCELCSYVVHIKCAINTSPATTTSINNANAADDKDVTQFPINNASEELIKPFVTRERGEMVIPHDENINGKYQFHNHHHQLSLISSEENGDDDDDDEEEDDDLDNRRGRSELICDGCATPIYRKEQKSSSSSSPNSDKYYYYMSCGECKYFLHLACFHLPPELPSHPLHEENHKLMLQTCPKLDWWERCRICLLYTNGLMYACTECDFNVDIKCASLPNTIKHAAHPHHYLKQLNKVVTRDVDYLRRLCGCCGSHTYRKACYGCDTCEFILHCRCALLPPANKDRWEKHPLPLTYDANLNHPAEFYCDTCEEEMNPKQWMYHCRECDHSFHPHCFPTTSGWYRNIKFGQQYLITTCHPHPLTFVLLTTKLRCDRCNCYVCGEHGFQCATCNFVLCNWNCSRKHRDALKAID